MTRRIRGFRRKTRYKFKKSMREKGKLSITRYLQTLKPGEKVSLSLESSVQRGMYFPRFMGKTGIVKGKKGRCYEVLIKDGNKEKLLIIHPIHLKRVKNG